MLASKSSICNTRNILKSQRRFSLASGDSQTDLSCAQCEGLRGCGLSSGTPPWRRERRWDETVKLKPITVSRRVWEIQGSGILTMMVGLGSAPHPSPVREQCLTRGIVWKEYCFSGFHYLIYGKEERQDRVKLKKKNAFGGLETS